MQTFLSWHPGLVAPGTAFLHNARGQNKTDVVQDTQNKAGGWLTYVK